MYVINVILYYCLAVLFKLPNYSYGLITLAITRAITGHTRTSKSTDYFPNYTQKYVINYTNCLARFYLGMASQAYARLV